MKGAKMTDISEAIVEKKREIAKRKRQEYVDAVLNSSSEKKIVVAGPGTGKTYLFKEILGGKRNTLTLSFVNALVEDLSLELCGISDVRTLHGFALKIMGKAVSDMKVFPELTKVIKEDAKIILGEDIDFEFLFNNRDDESKFIDFYKKRRKYYGHYGYSDIVFAAVKYFEKNKNTIPKYTQVVIDEFQDFNKLEMSLIDLLAEKSDVLITGDDDQALYDFKSASPVHIRERFSNDNKDYTPFTLPYCSRCTRVIIEAVNDIIVAAKKAGHLTNRVNKSFLYFDSEEKDKVCDANSKLIYKKCQASEIPYHIQKSIEAIANEERKEFTVLVITPFNKQKCNISDALRNKGFKNVLSAENRDTREPTLLDGLKLLIEAKGKKCDKCNLGWRIVAKYLLDGNDFNKILNKSNEDDSVLFSKLIEEAGNKKEVSKMLTILRKIKKDGEIEDTEFNEFLKKICFDPYKMAKDCLKKELVPYEKSYTNPGIKKIPITVTTIPKAKGLDADYVFIPYFDDRYLIGDKNPITDQKICNFIVALTRARKKVFLISSVVNKNPVFLQWIDDKRIERL